ncbi:helix-turn-helix domain-containing protein [Streptomyces sp. TRM66268-LWL]|uniref:Helix-turn-helix domain-containing protein n=1 Tax=Streptomyces polyasparticus TaxID=2767826 RepID=A0ABR7S6B7_9ACTN|nr:helix-turn-helix transcriptional regulator [Streptomyces polyasparticus]MBC9711031.1 helix-turn-helix domain-containing protein [Streptomyces polyasparticus]
MTGSRAEGAPELTGTPGLRSTAAQRHGGPTVLRIVLGTHLRRLREASGITREDAGDAIRASHAKISRVELGRVAQKERDVADLLTLYGVTDPDERAEYLDLARRASNPGWWQKYSDVMPSWLETILGLEEAAAVIRSYQVQFVPGLLQTSDYARSVVSLGEARGSVREIERKVELRLRRQELLTRPEAPKLWFVVDEAALRRPMGGRLTMRTQLRRLIEVAEMPHVTLQVAPFGAGGLAAAGGPITILRFDEPDLPDIVYLEQLTSALYLDKRADVENYMAVMDQVCSAASDTEASVRFLEELLDSYY